MIILTPLLIIYSVIPVQFDSNFRLKNYIETCGPVRCGELRLESIETLESGSSWKLLRANLISYYGSDHRWEFIETNSQIARVGAMDSGIDSYAIIRLGEFSDSGIICTYSAGSGTYYSFLDWYFLRGNRIIHACLPFCYDEGECVIVKADSNLFYILDLKTKDWIGELEFRPQRKEWFFKVNKDLKEEISKKVTWHGKIIELDW